MNTSFFIAKKIRFAGKASFSATVIQISTASIALGIAVLIVSFAILQGFRDNIYKKIFSFGGQLTVRSYSQDSYYEEKPIEKSTPIYKNIKRLPDVAHIQQYSFKPALLRANKDVQGIVLKGIDTDFNFKGFVSNMVAGKFLQLNDTNASPQIVMSQRLAGKLKVRIGEEVILYFIQDPPRYRKVKLAGLFKTHLEEYDNNMVLAPMHVVRQLNGWNASQSGGFEIFIKDFAQFDRVFDAVLSQLTFDLGLEKITDTQKQIFEWLSMIGRNVDVILVLITLVACFNIISTLLIMILERTNMVGVLKATGATDFQIQKIFWTNGLLIAGKGILYGNGIGILICLLQSHFQFITLNPENYYMEFVPIAWNWEHFLIVNTVTMVSISFALLLPTLVVLRIKPSQAIQFA